MSKPSILTTTVGSYPVPEWLAAFPSEQAVIDATRVIFDTQRSNGIDLPTDGELYRFDINHPDTNGMIEYFLKPMGGCDSSIGRTDTEAFRAKQEMGLERNLLRQFGHLYIAVLLILSKTVFVRNQLLMGTLNSPSPVLTCFQELYSIIIMVILIHSP